MGETAVTKADKQVMAVKKWIDMAKPAIAAALPRIGLTPERIARVTLTTVTSTPLLLECDPKTIAVAMIRAAQLGLVPDPVLGEAYIVPRWNSKRQCYEASFQKGYRGVLKLIRRTGELGSVRAEIRYARDYFKRLPMGDIEFEPFDGDDRGKRLGAFVVFYFKDGFCQSHYMTIREVYEIRDKFSESWKAFKAGKIKDTPWKEGEPAEKWMILKTVIFQGAHLAPMETEGGQKLVAAALEEEMDVDNGTLARELFDGPETIDVEATGDRATTPATKAATIKQSLRNAKKKGEEAEAAFDRPAAVERLTRAAMAARNAEGAKLTLAEVDVEVSAATEGKVQSFDVLANEGTAEQIDAAIAHFAAMAKGKE
jgi:recombination protein RecT